MERGWSDRENIDREHIWTLHLDPALQGGGVLCKGNEEILLSRGRGREREGERGRENKKTNDQWDRKDVQR